MGEDIHKHSVHTLVFRSLKRTHDMFLNDYKHLNLDDSSSDIVQRKVKTKDEYGLLVGLNNDPQSTNRSKFGGPVFTNEDNLLDSETNRNSRQLSDRESKVQNDENLAELIVEKSKAESFPLKVPIYSSDNQQSKALIHYDERNTQIAKRNIMTMPKPQWHAPWKLYRVISGHLGWVRCVDVEPGNEWFATGSGDRLIKIWDLASGSLKLSLTGHISAVRGIAISKRHPYLFSCGEDKQVKCWDLEYNKVIRHYHGHLSACYALSLHPTLDLVVSAGRDSVARVWDIRTKAQVHCLEGHTNTVADVKCQETDPQIITCSHDSTIRCWDIIAGKTSCTLTNHKKSVRSIVLHPKWNSMASASPDNIKEWKLPRAEFVQNLSGHNAIINSLATNSDNVLVSGADNGSLYFWDWITGYNFQRLQSAAQTGSIDSEMGIFAMTFDQSGSRMITCEADKTIKIYKEDEEASEETHPINWKPDILKRKRF